ncbi:MAG: hypothetical protein ACREVS_07505 [Burkholderiales bacterium]
MARHHDAVAPGRLVEHRGGRGMAIFGGDWVFVHDALDVGMPIADVSEETSLSRARAGCQKAGPRARAFGRLAETS